MSGNRTKVFKKVALWTILLSPISSLTLAPIQINAQQQVSKVEGTIRDREGKVIAGATIRESGTKNTVTTSPDGSFTIQVSSQFAELEISHVGSEPARIAINGKKRLDVVLLRKETALGEVVVTALGIKRETKALGYAVAEVNAESLTAGREQNMVSALSGKVAGVDISSTSGGPAGSTRVIIRGNSQLSGTNNPLYVIDGVPMDNSQMGDAGKFGGYDFGDGISSISPSDIETVSVLKGASAAALYGSRASNGVVLITTKSGKKNKKIGIDFSSSANVVNLLSKFDDYQRMYGQGRDGMPPLNDDDAQSTSMSAWGPRLDPNISFPIYNGEIKDYGNKDNNVLSFFRTGSTLNNTVSFDGGGESTSFRMSVSDMRNKDIIPSSTFNRTTFMIRGNSKLGKKLTINSRVNYSVEDVNNRPGLSDVSSNIGNAIIGLAPNFDQKWLSENYKDELGRYMPWNDQGIYRLNPYWVINEMANTTARNRVLGHLQLDYNFLPGFNLTARAGTDFYDFNIMQFASRYTPTAQAGEMSNTDRNVREDNYEAILRYSTKFKEKWDISAFIGGNIRRSSAKNITNLGRDQVLDDIRSITNYKEHVLSHSLIRKRVNSVYGAVNLGYNDFLYVDLTLRNDVSSTLSADNRSYTYPSASGSFIFSKLLKMDNHILSFGKLRASVAKVGGDTDPYQLSLVYGLADITFQGMRLGEIKSKVIPNQQLKPTSTYSYEIGTDLRFLKERLTLDFSYYKQSTKDQILSLPSSLATGYSKGMINAGEIVNRGVEIALNATAIKTKDWEWSTGINFARNRNLVKSLHPDLKNYELASARWANAFIYAQEGETYGVIAGTAFQRAPNGEIIHKSGLPQYEKDLKVLGKGVYDFTLGFKQGLRYQDFNLSMLFDVKWGGEIYAMTALQSYKYGTSTSTLEGREGWNASEEQRLASGKTAQEWVPTGGYIGKGVKNIGTDDQPEYVPNDEFINPNAYWNNVTNNTAEPFIYDASFIKLRELNLTYSLPVKKMFGKAPVQSASIFVYGRNLWTVYDKVVNIDPESNYSSGNGQGFEYGSLPSRRTFGIGIDIKF
ncbi:MAG: SusC/RagA family TonB-linked outer membrane protein [Sphingobacterium sp.]|jgi:TonB-linked SusC/RagA family outer membrane protein|nr:SusC/RagA family TonB-linked outer membrane protein [Sphingobacterium sp.]